MYSYFQDLAFSPEVVNERFVSNSAVLALGDMLRRAQVNKHIFHSRYPTYTFGPMAAKNNHILREYTDKISELLREAFAQEDKPRIQLFIRAIGNLGHPKALEILAQYLENKGDKQQLTEFQRLLIVTSMDKLVINYPKVARAILFRIYEDTTENHAVRCAAVHLLMNTNPPVVLLQRMAEFTNVDQSQQVISAVQSAIKSAANLNGETEL